MPLIEPEPASWSPVTFRRDGRTLIEPKDRPGIVNVVADQVSTVAEPEAICKTCVRRITKYGIGCDIDIEAPGRAGRIRSDGRLTSFESTTLPLDQSLVPTTVAFVHTCGIKLRPDCSGCAHLARFTVAVPGGYSSTSMTPGQLWWRRNRTVVGGYCQLPGEECRYEPEAKQTEAHSCATCAFMTSHDDIMNTGFGCQNDLTSVENHLARRRAATTGIGVGVAISNARYEAATRRVATIDGPDRNGHVSTDLAVSGFLRTYLGRILNHHVVDGVEEFVVRFEGESASATRLSPAWVGRSGLTGPMSITPSSYVGAEGNITFTVKNAGRMAHEMIVLKTDTPFDQIPVTDAGDPPAPVTTGANKVDEANNVGETGSPTLKPGETRTFSVELAAGKYVLVCNLAGHYQMGMRAPFTVTPSAGQAPAAPSAVSVQLSDHDHVGVESVTLRSARTIEAVILTPYQRLYGLLDPPRYTQGYSYRPWHDPRRMPNEIPLCPDAPCPTCATPAARGVRPGAVDPGPGWVYRWSRPNRDRDWVRTWELQPCPASADADMANPAPLRICSGPAPGQPQAARGRIPGLPPAHLVAPPRPDYAKRCHPRCVDCHDPVPCYYHMKAPVEVVDFDWEADDAGGLRRVPALVESLADPTAADPQRRPEPTNPARHLQLNPDWANPGALAVLDAAGAAPHPSIFANRLASLLTYCQSDAQRLAVQHQLWDLQAALPRSAAHAIAWWMRDTTPWQLECELHTFDQGHNGFEELGDDGVLRHVNGHPDGDEDVIVKYASGDAEVRGVLARGLDLVGLWGNEFGRTRTEISTNTHYRGYSPVVARMADEAWRIGSGGAALQGEIEESLRLMAAKGHPSQPMPAKSHKVFLRPGIANSSADTASINAVLADPDLKTKPEPGEGRDERSWFSAMTYNEWAHEWPGLAALDDYYHTKVQHLGLAQSRSGEATTMWWTSYGTLIGGNQLVRSRDDTHPDNTLVWQAMVEAAADVGAEQDYDGLVCPVCFNPGDAIRAPQGYWPLTSAEIGADMRCPTPGCGALLEYHSSGTPLHLRMTRDQTGLVADLAPRPEDAKPYRRTGPRDGTAPDSPRWIARSLADDTSCGHWVSAREARRNRAFLGQTPPVRTDADIRSEAAFVTRPAVGSVDRAVRAARLAALIPESPAAS